jgi:hypothetical protein
MFLFYPPLSEGKEEKKRTGQCGELDTRKPQFRYCFSFTNPTVRDFSFLKYEKKGLKVDTPNVPVFSQSQAMKWSPRIGSRREPGPEAELPT